MADALLNQYLRVPPPTDPESSHAHLDGELGKIERTTRETIARLNTLATTYAPLVSPVLTGDPQAPTPPTSDNDVSIATTAFVKAQDYATNTALTAGLAPKADTSALAGYATTGALSTGLAGKADTSALAPLAPLASPALTGAPTAPTQASGDNSTKLATTAYADMAAPWKLIKKTADQTVSSASFVDDAALTFTMAASTTYAIRGVFYLNTGAGGYQFACNGPASPTKIRAHVTYNQLAIVAYNTQIMATAGANFLVVPFTIKVENGATAGAFVMRLAQLATNAAVTTIEKGSFIEYLVV